jgi:hypothetical protein
VFHAKRHRRAASDARRCQLEHSLTQSRTHTMKLLYKCLFIHFASVCICVSQTITFDDLPSTPFAQPHDPMPIGYAGLQWNNFRVLNGSDSMASGYLNGVVSAKNVIYNFNGDPAHFTNGTPFNLDSAYVTAAWNDGLQLEVQGFAGSSLVYDMFYTVDTGGPTFITFNYLGVTQMSFISYGGTHHPGYLGTGTMIALDNLAISPSLSAIPSPRITNFTAAAGRVVLGGDSGPTSRIYYVLSSTNATLPLTQWSRIATNQFDFAGHFIETNVFDPSTLQRFYLLQLP